MRTDQQSPAATTASGMTAEQRQQPGRYYHGATRAKIDRQTATRAMNTQQQDATRATIPREADRRPTGPGIDQQGQRQQPTARTNTARSMAQDGRTGRAVPGA
ncbi:MAG: hypothetical protein ACLFUJ_05515, partial [Phycisphaerae bacterium]